MPIQGLVWALPFLKNRSKSKSSDFLPKLRHGCSNPERKFSPHNDNSKSKNPNLRTELAGVLKINQVGLDKAELHRSEREKTLPFYLLKWVWAKLNNVLSWPPVYTLFFVCLALLVVQGSPKADYVHMCTLC
jgi:hypothetical protein